MPRRRTKIKDQQARNEWRDKVYIKCGHQCACCHTSKDIQAHHLYSYKDYPEFRFDINNGVVLCRNCHAACHELGKDFSLEEFIRFYRKNGFKGLK